jgi:hypothetical protein
MIQSARIRGVLAPVVTPFKLVRCPLARSYRRHFTFYVADPISSIQTESRTFISLAPARLDRYPRGFTGHVAHPSRSIHVRAESFLCSRN